ncbi:18.1 kDa class I heat shock protein-like [Aristolochia californica]|uniref:18.1 kDa class I heat shock protein-like n=1 Tax=Aristolochia californica TaxID=171875 RepID=UPI0035D5F553
MSIIPTFFGKQINCLDPFSLDIWDPFEGFPFSNTPAAPRLNLVSKINRVSSNKIDWKETPEAHIIEAHLPGYRLEDLKVEIEEGKVLQVSGQRCEDEAEDKHSLHCQDQKGCRKFLKRFRLPDDAKADLVKATMEREVLIVTVPIEVKKPQVKAIEISAT